MAKYTEDSLENSFITFLQEQGYEYLHGDAMRDTYAVQDPAVQYGRKVSEEVLIRQDLKDFLLKRYREENITDSEVERIIRELEVLPASDLYESNKAIHKKIADGYTFKRDDFQEKDIFIQFIDFDNPSNNEFKVVNQLAIDDVEMRIPDVIIYINGLPLVVIELKTATREEVKVYDAYEQVTIRYRRAIPELLKYNAFCIISDGVNSLAGSLFAPYEFYSAWKKITGNESVEKEGIDSTYTLIEGMLRPERLLDVIHNFIFFPDTSKKEEKILCRYPQYYAARKLFENIKLHLKPEGDGKGGTYFGATGCGKSFTMLFLTRLLMKSTYLSSPTIVLITDRTDLDSQLSEQFGSAKGYIGDEMIQSVLSRQHLRELLQGRNSGGVFLTTIHKFTEDTQLLTDRNNVICISDEAHRSQVNLDQKVTVTEKGVKKSFGFAKYLHDSLPNATYVGFTGTPIDATLDVFGEVVDSYTMNESVTDNITVKIVYEGRAAKVLLNNEKLQEIEQYYEQAEAAGSSEYQIEESKKATAKMNTILGDRDRLKAVAEDFVKHYEQRISEGATVKGKAMFVCSSREIAWEFYKLVIDYLGERSSLGPRSSSSLGPRSSSFEDNPGEKSSSSLGPRSSSFEDNPNERSSSSLGPRSSSFEDNPNERSSSSADIDSTNYASYFTNSFGYPEEWHTTNLPHRNRKNLLQFITFRLADSLPQDVLKKIENDIEQLSGDKKDVEKRKKYQYWLDQGLGSCALANREMAQVVQEALKYHDGEKYDLLSWSIMPNHVHVLIRTKEDLPRIVQSWKSYTGKWALANNKKFQLGIDPKAKAFWMADYWDRFIRDEDHFNNTVRYILNNPVKAKLPENHAAYFFRGCELSESMKQELHPTQVKMVMTRGKDDPEELYNLLGTKEYKQELDRQFKEEKSNFKVAIVVDMWLTGFDVPFLDTLYIDKPLQKHSLIQTISRVNRTYEGKKKGLVVDYFGIKRKMNQALAMYSKEDEQNFEDIQQSIIVVRDMLDVLAKYFHKFETTDYFNGSSTQQLDCLKRAAEFVQLTRQQEKRFMDLVKRLKASYDICCGNETFSDAERDQVHFYLAVRSIIYKLTKGNAPDTAQMNIKVREMIEEAIRSDGVEEIFKLGEDNAQIDLFDEDYMEKINRIKLPNTKIKLLQQLLKKAIGDLKKTNRARGINFSEEFEDLVNQYNERKEQDTLEGRVYDEMAESLTDMIVAIKAAYSEGDELGISFEEKAFYDILKELAHKYDFEYPEDKLIVLSQKVKEVVDDKAKYTDWSKRNDIKAELKVDLILLLGEHDYPPVDRDEVYEEIFQQAENFKKHRG